MFRVWGSGIWGGVWAGVFCRGLSELPSISGLPMHRDPFGILVYIVPNIFLNKDPRLLNTRNGGMP